MGPRRSGGLGSRLVSRKMTLSSLLSDWVRGVCGTPTGFFTWAETLEVHLWWMRDGWDVSETSPVASLGLESSVRPNCDSDEGPQRTGSGVNLG